MHALSFSLCPFVICISDVSLLLFFVVGDAVVFVGVVAVAANVFFYLGFDFVVVFVVVVVVVVIFVMVFSAIVTDFRGFWHERL